MGGYVASYITKAHGGVDIPVLVCSPAPTTLDPAEAAGVSVAASAVGMLLLAYCGYVSWYGRWGLPRLQRVSVCAVYELGAGVKAIAGPFCEGYNEAVKLRGGRP